MDITDETDDALGQGEDLLFGFQFGALDLLTVTTTIKAHQGAIPSDHHEDKRLAERREMQGEIRDMLQLKRQSVRPVSLNGDISNDEKQIEKDAIFHRLIAWATLAHGADLTGITSGRDSYGGRGLFAARQVTTVGSVLAVLPRSLRVGHTLACQRVAGGKLPIDCPDLTAVSLLVLTFYRDALEMGDGGASSADVDPDNWGLYAQSLPHSSSEINNSSLATVGEIESCLRKLQLAMTDSGETTHSYCLQCEKVRSKARCCLQYIQQVLLRNDDIENNSQLNSGDDDIPRHSAIHWAIAIVMSRNHAFGSNTGSRWLTPVFDTANHASNPNCQLQGDSEGQLLLKALRPLDKEDEITIDYQVDHDANLLATYGFSQDYPGICL